MRIFDVQIFAGDADWFMAQSCAAKKRWIKANTNQKSDTLIDEFIKGLKRGNDDECDECKNKHKIHGDSNTVPKETTAASKPSKPARNRSKGNSKGK